MRCKSLICFEIAKNPHRCSFHKSETCTQHLTNIGYLLGQHRWVCTHFGRFETGSVNHSLPEKLGWTVAYTKLFKSLKLPESPVVWSCIQGVFLPSFLNTDLSLNYISKQWHQWRNWLLLLLYICYSQSSCLSLPLQTNSSVSCKITCRPTKVYEGLFAGCTAIT